MNGNEVQAEVMPEESPKTELSNVLNEGDPDLQLAILERKAAIADRVAKAINTILISQTYPEDWKQFGTGDNATVCLSSAGAERVARHFGIKIFDVVSKREDFTDSIGKGYRYVFDGKASMADRLIYAQGTYSTRDKFLGFKNDEWKPLEDINENDIRDAAYHIFTGNAIKGLLGLRGIPASRFQEIMKGIGEKTDKTTKITHGSGTQGGTSQGDTAKQQELAKILIDLANNQQMITVDEEGQYVIEQASEMLEQMDIARSSCKNLTSFWSKRDNKVIEGIDSVKSLKGKRLDIALANAKALTKDD